MTSQNAGLVAESSAAARELFHQAHRLEAGAGRFRINDQNHLEYAPNAMKNDGQATALLGLQPETA